MVNQLSLDLRKSLYGLKQAHEKNTKCCIRDMCVFTLFDDDTNERVIVLLWVDDIIITDNSVSIVQCKENR